MEIFKEWRLNLENGWNCRSFSATSLFFGLLTLATLVGCGESVESTVFGTVSLEGVLLERGTVTFSPLSNQGRSATGPINAEGKYQVQAAMTGGLPAGEYEVSITSREPATPHPRGGPPTPGKLITPAFYRNPDISGLRFEVVPGPNEFDLELTTDRPTKTSKKAKGRP